MTPWNGAALSEAAYSAAELGDDGTTIFVLDQRELPDREVYLRVTDLAGAASAIRDMAVRGAPAIGITAAYGMTLAAHAARGEKAAGYRSAMEEAGATLEATRPTAVNLAWAVRRCLDLVGEHAEEPGEARHGALAELARSIHRDDVAACRAMGEVGAGVLPEGAHRILTHCNAGALATGGFGTALGVIRAAAVARSGVEVLATETRPYWQGARLTAWELSRDAVPVRVITDNMVGHCMARGMVEAVVVGADRIAANGDVANKIGTYAIALLARAHDVPFYVAAPWSTVDLATPNGAAIPIEERAALEVTHARGHRVVPDGVGVYNPAFDVTPADLVAAIITERGAFAPHALHGAG